jgi:hypothetical protein
MLSVSIPEHSYTELEVRTGHFVHFIRVKTIAFYISDILMKIVLIAHLFCVNFSHLRANICS